MKMNPGKSVFMYWKDTIQIRQGQPACCEIPLCEANNHNALLLVINI